MIGARCSNGATFIGFHTLASHEDVYRKVHESILPFVLDIYEDVHGKEVFGIGITISPARNMTEAHGLLQVELDENGRLRAELKKKDEEIARLMAQIKGLSV